MHMKKRIIILILTAFAVLSAFVTTQIHANAILGDVNHDSVLDVGDAYAILEHCASIGAGNGETLSDTALISADYSANDKIDTRDAFKILVSLSKSGQPVPSGLNELNTEEWKQAYAIQLDHFQSYKNRYELADITGDSIPELFIMLGDTSETMVYTYQNGSCQQIYFPTENGAVQAGGIYISSGLDGLFIQSWDYPVNTITNYEITEKLQAIPKYKLIRDYINGSYYFEDMPITKEEYYHYQESACWVDQFCDIKNRDLLKIYGSGEVQIYLIKSSVQFERGFLTFKINCKSMNEKSNITFHVVPHGTEHKPENAIEDTEYEFYMKNLYEAVHDDDFKAYCLLREIPDGDYDLFLLADDKTELKSITFQVKENKSVYIY